MNNLFKKNIAIYSGIAGVLLLSDDSKAQVIYTDISPDTLIDVFTQPYNLDVDADGVPDFIFNSYRSYMSSAGGYSGPMYYSTTIMAWISGNPFSSSFITPNRVLTFNNAHCFYPEATRLIATQAISSTLTNWSVVGTVEFSKDCVSGWPFNSFYFAGLKFVTNGQTHYAWLRVKALDKHRFILSDYAFEAQADSAIIAGRTSSPVGIDELFNATKIIQDGNHIQMNFDSNISNAKITVSNILGQEISSQNFSGNIFETEISSKGIFLISLSSEKTTTVKKVFIY